MIETGHARDEIRRVPVYSLYSETREPTAEMLRELDVLVIDLQDVGTRIYTYIYTMANCLRAARRHGVKVIVCDRPNPIGGDRRRGADARRRVRVVRRPVSDSDAARDDHRRAGAAVQRALRDRRGPRGRDDGGVAADTVCGRRPACRGCCRRRTFRPSTARSCIPGTVLFEGTNVSEGRGTTRPFELVGAPWVAAERFADAMNRLGLPGRPLPAGGVRADVSQARAEPAAAAARFTCWIARRSGRSKPASRCSARFAPRDTGRVRSGASRRTNTSTRNCRSTSSPGRPSCGSRSTPASPAREIARSWETPVDAFLTVRRAVSAVLTSKTTKSRESGTELVQRFVSSCPSWSRLWLFPRRVPARRESARRARARGSRRSRATARRCSGRFRCAFPHGAQSASVMQSRISPVVRRAALNASSEASIGRS